MTDKTKLIAEMKSVAEDLVSRTEELCQLDSFVGDGDHGISIHKGFGKVLEYLGQLEDGTRKPEEAAANAGPVTEVFHTCADAVLDSMGGAIGPIFASVFIGFEMASKGKEALSLGDWKECFTKALEVVTATGEAKPGERTLVDTLYAAVQAFDESKGSDAEQWTCIEQRAKEGMESTKNMQAKRGRARYLRERSVGYVDAGATTMYYFIRKLAEAERGGQPAQNG